MDTIREHEGGQGCGWRQFVAAVVKPGEKAPPAVALPANSIMAYINEGRWIAECPAGDGMAFCASFREPLFWCPLCGNAANGGQWLNVAFPPQKAAIERLLLLRPAVQNRNWVWPETVAGLARENLDHWLGV